MSFHFMAAVTICSDFGAQKIKSDTVSPSISHEVMKKAERRRIDAFELVLEKTLESPLDCKEIQPVHPKGDQSWVFFGRTDVEAKLQYFGHLM